MCGIMAVKGDDAIAKTVDGLKRLEYRGYDSCGVAFVNNGIEVIKTKGYVSVLSEKVRGLNSNIAIGHTRWATHGEPSVINSHPQSSATGNFVCVHNGIIENYLELKKDILNDIKFVSDTDTEVIPNLVEHFYLTNSCSVLDAFKMTINLLRGSYAIVMLNSVDNNMYFARSSSPMVLAKTASHKYISSDIFGLHNKDYVYYLPDNTYGYLGNDFHVFDKNSTPCDIEYTNYSRANNNVETLKQDHYMLKEIYEIPQAIKDTKEYMKDLELKLPSEISRILFVACGTSYHASLVAKKQIEKYAHVPCDVEIASEFLVGNYLSTPNTLAIFLSQSGETADTLKSITLAKSMGMYTLGVTNVAGSSITHMTDEVIVMQAGVEVCVASTKAYTTQIYVLLQVANLIINIIKIGYHFLKKKKQEANQNKLIDSKNSSVGKLSKIKNKKSKLKKYVILNLSQSKQMLDTTDLDEQQLIELDISQFETAVDKIVEDIYKSKTMHLIGKDLDYITAMEGSLKIKEISYIFTDAYPCGELKHGTLSLIEKGSVVFVIMTERELISKTMNSIHEVVARGGKVIVLTQFEDIAIPDAEYIIHLPNLHPAYMPIVSIIPLHLISYKISKKLGLNPDKPRNLAKAVTVE